jgi:hypothetical protein
VGERERVRDFSRSNRIQSVEEIRESWPDIGGEIGLMVPGLGVLGDQLRLRKGETLEELRDFVIKPLSWYGVAPFPASLA